MSYLAFPICVSGLKPSGATTRNSWKRHLRENCGALGIPFFDTGPDFVGGLASAEFFLIKKD
jgi:hypothetical protein